MSTESLLQALELPANADINEVERKFTDMVKDRIQQVAEKFDEESVAAEEAWLRQAHKDYFALFSEWVNKQAAQYKNVREEQNADKLRQEAKSVIGELQEYIVEFTSCYMHINRFQTLLRDEIKKEELRLGANITNMKWSSDSGQMIARYRKERLVLMERTQRMGVAREVLEAIEGDFETVRKAAEAMFGKDAEKKMRSFMSALRMKDAKKAQRALRDITQAKKKFTMDQKTADNLQKAAAAAGQKIMTVVQKAERILLSEDEKLFLKPLETDLAYNVDIKQLQKVKGFLSKYHLPYMQHKLDNLSHLKDKLIVLNTLDSLMVLYKRLMAGIALPMQDMKSVRSYESDVVNNAKYLLSGHFQELPKILERAEQTVEEFRKGARDFEELEDMSFEEIAVDKKSAIQN